MSKDMITAAEARGITAEAAERREQLNREFTQKLLDVCYSQIIRDSKCVQYSTKVCSNNSKDIVERAATILREPPLSFDVTIEQNGVKGFYLNISWAIE